MWQRLSTQIAYPLAFSVATLIQSIDYTTNGVCSVWLSKTCSPFTLCIKRLHKRCIGSGCHGNSRRHLTQCDIDGIDANGVRQRMEPHMDAFRRYVTKKEHKSSSKSGNELLAFANLLGRMGSFSFCYDFSIGLRAAMACCKNALDKFVKYGADAKNGDLAATLGKMEDFLLNQPTHNVREMVLFCQEGLEMCHEKMR